MRISDWRSDVCSSDRLWVEVAGGQDEGDAVALLQLHAAHLVVLIEHAAREGDRPAAQQLLDDPVDVLRAIDDLLHFRRVPGEIEPDVVQCGEHGVEPADEQEADETEDLLVGQRHAVGRSEEHTSELQSLMRISYAVFCLKKKNV